MCDSLPVVYPASRPLGQAASPPCDLGWDKREKMDGADVAQQVNKNVICLCRGMKGGVL